MPNPHPTSRLRAPIALTSVGAPAREPPRARVRRAGALGYDRLVAAFPHLPEPLSVELAQGVEETFLAGETIVRDGDPADRFYIIESGQVEETPFPHEADDVHVLTIQAGDYFGEVGLLATRTRTATVRSVSEVRVISLDGAEFQALVEVSESTATQLGRLVDHWTRSELSQRTTPCASPAIRNRSRRPSGGPQPRVRGALLPTRGCQTTQTSYRD